MTSRDPKGSRLTLKGQGRDPEIFEAQYLGNRARYRVGVNGPPIGTTLCESYGHVTDDVTLP